MDHERRGPPRGGGYNNNRKKRFRDDLDDYERRGPPAHRRRYNEPHSNLPYIRKLLLSLADSQHKRPEEEIYVLAAAVADNAHEEACKNGFIDLAVKLVVEQPFKIPFVAGFITVLNGLKGVAEPGAESKGAGAEIVQEVMNKAAKATENGLAKGEWREVKLLLKFLGSLQGLYDDEGVWPVLEELFSRAVDLQTASSDDTLGTELVKIILFTIPYIMASAATDCHQKAVDLLDKTGVIASAPHVLEVLVNPYPGTEAEPDQPISVIGLLQKQLESEATKNWELACIPKVWKFKIEGDQEIQLDEPVRHSLPPIFIPETVYAGSKPLFPEIYFSVYANQDVETVPPTTDIASCILRDNIVDTINILDFNRNATSKYLIDLDCYFAPNTFVKRATPFDRLREADDDKPTWKPEDVAVDAVFSQLFQLPSPEHKVVYYHSVLTEACKLAPAAIAPSLGRAIRYLYNNSDSMDLELAYRFQDWFAHHLSNFGYTWKWIEWVDDVELSHLHPKRAFIEGALDKEIRLAFPSRIKGTLPEQYRPLIPEERDQELPPFKFDAPDSPFREEAQELRGLIRSKATDELVQPLISKIEEMARSVALDPLITSTDIFVNSICFAGAKSLSHVLSHIERCRDRLVQIGLQSEAGRRQIITSVMSYWQFNPGTGINIVDKLLNFSVLTPLSVIEWALVTNSNQGRALAESHIYEMISSTVFKVTNRVRMTTKSRLAARQLQGALDEQQQANDEEQARTARAISTELFRATEEALSAWADGVKDEGMENANVENGGEARAEESAALIREWGQRWVTVFRRKFAVEEAYLLELERTPIPVPEPAAIEAEKNGAANGDGAGVGAADVMEV